jgi:hypothetical protein
MKTLARDAEERARDPLSLVQSWFFLAANGGALTHDCTSKRNVCSAVSQNVIVAPASRSDPFPAFAIALTAGLISGVSATKRRLRMVAFGIRHLFLQRHEQQNGA